MTPEERRQDLIQAAGRIVVGEDSPEGIQAEQEEAGLWLDGFLLAFDNHPDPNERALGQMLRNGVTKMDCVQTRPHLPHFILADIDDEPSVDLGDPSQYDLYAVSPPTPYETASPTEPQKRCGLCNHEITFERCGMAANEDGTPLCHADDHSCYHRWTVYGERPEQ